ncbi:Flp pilus assembly protein CpaB [Jannaschia sp. Os4]|uniref:Flp pilus assembly protein CpaB n=1 Tax=Jannaschia sp. Os4 TaxID=2807617 RepID=UPI001939F356|nr:Flp pilus assembly protein CpaB [Jannaschia sp. Os4]MBM2574845.1 Flp pilus assembly protein CpaB [Jannaschia sp. Os4]
MRIIFAVILLAGLGLAGFAVHTAQNRFAQYQAALQSSQDAIIPVTDVVVLARSLRYGQPVRRADLKLVPWPANALPEGAFRTPDEVFPAGSEGTRTVLRAMERNEPLLRVKVTEPGQDAGVAASLGEGMRAFALRVDVSSGVSGLLRPGDRVDVYWTGGGGRESSGLTRLIHANLQLIAVDQVTDEDRNNPILARTITVEAPADVVAKLAQAQATGSISLALVGVTDQTESAAVEATINEILGPQDTVQRARTCSIRTRRGAEVVAIQIPCPDE